MSKLMQSQRKAIESMNCASSVEKKNSGIPWMRLFAYLTLAETLFLVAVTIGAGQSEFSYKGLLASSAPCDLNFKIGGTAVTGTLHGDCVCKDMDVVHTTSSGLAGIDIVFQGTVSGGAWEGASTTITGTWTAVDPNGAFVSACWDEYLAFFPEWPFSRAYGSTNGAFSIFMQDSTVIFVMDGSKRANFKASGQIYTPTAGSGSCGPQGIVGTWSWFNGEKKVFNSDGTVYSISNTGSAENRATWELKDPSNQIYIVRQVEGNWIDTLTLSPDCNSLDGYNNVGIHVTGTRTTSSSGRASQCGPQGIVGTWSWFNGEKKVFNSDGTVYSISNTGSAENRATWELKDPSNQIYIVRQVEGNWIDTLTLSPDCNSLDGYNNVGIYVTGTRIS